MPERTSTASIALSLIFAVLFVAFAVWCGLRAADYWVSGSTVRTVIAVLGAVGGLSLGVRKFRDALVANRPNDPSTGAP